MKVLLVLGGILVLLIGVIYASNKNAVVEDTGMNISCLGGVEYWYRKSGYSAVLAVKYNQDGTINTCSN